MKNTLSTLFKIVLLLLLMTTVSCSPTVPQEQKAAINEAIKINQIGYYPEGPKLAVIEGDLEAERFYVTNPTLEDTLYTGILGEKRKSLFSSAITHLADFSAFKDTGTYVLLIPSLGVSSPFKISREVHKELTKGAIKSYYFQRMSTDLPEDFAGKWARAAGHPDTVVFIHASAVSANRSENTTISAPKGWYDAGDYNKYIVNSGITMGTLLSIYEDFPEYIRALPIDIPEKDNRVPDLLDEVLWNLRWMLTMQDPTDGGVYHKLTAAKFEGMIIPEKAKSPRYVVQKSTAASLDFAAVMAQSARVFSKFENELPGLADSCRSAAISAWNWAVENPDDLYDQTAMNKMFDPDITTGAYGDSDVSDEFIWAASELWITTGNKKYWDKIELPEEEIILPSWAQVDALGYYSLLRHGRLLEDSHPEMLEALQSKLIAFSERLVDNVAANAYATVMGGSESDFIWGSSAVAANQGIVLIQAYLLTGNRSYLQQALSNLDYLLGRNATGYSFVTGFGHKTPMYPHHRPSVADGVIDPIPGLVAGGPNPGQQDGCSGYPSKVPDESYVDSDCSYASNEVAINWNAPFVYLVAAMEALQGEL